MVRKLSAGVITTNRRVNPPVCSGIDIGKKGGLFYNMLYNIKPFVKKYGTKSAKFDTKSYEFDTVDFGCPAI